MRLQSKKAECKREVYSVPASRITSGRMIILSSELMHRETSILHDEALYDNLPFFVRDM
jgi:hypothetical protein